MAIFIASWIPYAVLMLVPLFMLAAGVQLYFMDRRQLESVETPWEDKFLALSGLLAGAFCLGALPPLAGMAMQGRIEGAERMMQVLPFGLAPAVLAGTFYALATHCPFDTPKLNALLDFAVFSTTACVCIWLATLVAIAFGLDVAELAQVPEFSDEVALRVFPWTAVALVGALVTIHVASHEAVNEPRRRPRAGRGVQARPRALSV